jgi:hypothetical protein
VWVRMYGSGPINNEPPNSRPFPPQVTCAGGPRERCQHGFPQAFVFHPSKTTFNSGLFRLSCPLLVKAVDEYEAQGGCVRCVRSRSDRCSSFI